jgi:hypothetical protein
MARPQVEIIDEDSISLWDIRSSTVADITISRHLFIWTASRSQLNGEVYAQRGFICSLWRRGQASRLVCYVCLTSFVSVCIREHLFDQIGLGGVLAWFWKRFSEGAYIHRALLAGCNDYCARIGF